MQSFETLAKKHFRNFLLELAASSAAGPANDGEETEVVVTTPAKPAKPAAGGKAPAKPAGKPAKPAPVVEEGEEGEEITLPQLRALGLELLQQKRGDEVAAICGEFGAKNISTVAPENFTELHARLTEALSV